MSTQIPKHVKSLISHISKTNSLERIYLKDLNIKKIQNGKLEATLKTPYHNNTGFLTFLVDSVTTIAGFEQSGKPGVSVSLDINRVDDVVKFSNQMAEAQTESKILKIVAEQISHSDSLAVQECRIFDGENDKIVAYGSHVKFIG